MALYDRQVNPILEALMAKMSAGAGPQQPKMTAPMPAQAPPMMPPTPQGLPQQQPQGLLNQGAGGAGAMGGMMNPMVLSMLKDKLAGGAQTPQVSQPGLDAAMSRFGGAIPTSFNLQDFQLPPEMTWFLGGGGL